MKCWPGARGSRVIVLEILMWFGDPDSKESSSRSICREVSVVEFTLGEFPEVSLGLSVLDHSYCIHYGGIECFARSLALWEMSRLQFLCTVG